VADQLMRTAAGALTVLAVLAPMAGLSGQQGEIPDLPRQRWEFFYQQRAFPFEQIPPLAYQRAREIHEARWSGLFAPPPPPIEGTQWEPIGPERIPNGTLSSTGRLSAIAIHPTNSSIIYIGGAQGGVWRTTDAGVTWTPLTDNECSLAMGSIAIDPNDPDIVYAGTGEQHFSGDSYYGCGVLRSTDGGNSWTQFGASVFQGPAGGAFISRVVIDPETAGNATTTTVYAASDRGLFRSINSGVTWSPSLAVNINERGRVTDLVFDPTDPDIMYAAVWGFQSSVSGIYRSTNGGDTWTQMGNGFPVSSVGRINIDIDPSNPTTLYASIHNSSNSSLLGILRTQNSGASWSQITASGAQCGLQCWYDMEIAVHPTNPDTLYFGGVSLYRSMDGGQTFQNITGPIHVDQHIIAFDPQNPDVMFVGNDGGIYRSNDAGTTWTTLNTNLALTQFYAGVSLHPTDPTTVLGGTQDNGTMEHLGTPEWGFVLGGDGGFTAIDQDDPSIRYAETQWVPNSGYSGPRKSIGGGSFNLQVSGINLNDQALFIPPLVMDPSNSSTLYFGTVRVYRTTNSASSWTDISGPLAGGSGRVSAIAIAQANPDVVYAGFSNAQIHVTTNGGQTWSPATTGIPSRYITDIAIQWDDPEIAYAAVSGFQVGHVFRTSNGGTNWQDISGDLPDVPVNAIILDPGDPNRILIGTDLGVFSTDNGGASWVPFNQGLPNVAVFDLAYNPNTGVLLAATHGRGMFTVQMATPIALEVLPAARADTVAEGETQIASDSADVQLFGTGAQSTTWVATHGVASWVAMTNASGTGSGTVRWDRNPTGLTAGIYVDTITVTVIGAIDSPARVIDTLHVLADIALTVTPTSSSDSAAVGQTQVIPDSADVDFIGTGGEAVDWTAVASNGTWLSVANANGTGPDIVRWERDPSSLAIGTYVDTITVTAPGVLGSPARIVDTLKIQPPLTLTLMPSSIRVSAVEGQVDPLEGAGTVSLTGFGAATAAWTATHGAGAWLSMGDDQGSGSGTVTWMRDLGGLTPGHYVDTITVTVAGAQGSPALLVDTLTIVTPLVLEVDPLMRNDTAFTGDTAAVVDSAEIVLTGGDSQMAMWQASVTNGTWVTLSQSSGQGSGYLRWTRRPTTLSAGTHDAAITVTVNGADGSPVTVVDRFVILAPPITLEEAVDALLNEATLSEEQLSYLDERGNGDGIFNLGDVMAYLERSRENETTVTDAAGRQGREGNPGDRR
jgi:photosystem II stability/assembly factor-like uncharacterized protein